MQIRENNRNYKTVFKPSSEIFFTDRSRTVLLLWILLCYLCVMSVMLSCLLFAALWSPDGKGMASWLSPEYDVFLCFVTFSCGVLGQVWYLIVSISYLCLFFTFITKRSDCRIILIIYPKGCFNVWSHFKLN